MRILAVGLLAAGMMAAGPGAPIMVPTTVGSWAQYHCITRAEIGWGVTISHTAEFRIAIVGKEQRDVPIDVSANTPDGGTMQAEATGPADFLWVEVDVFTEGEKTLKVKALVQKDALAALPMTPVEDLTTYFQALKGVAEVIVQKGDEDPGRQEVMPQDRDTIKIPPWGIIQPLLKSFSNISMEEGDRDTVLTQAGKFDARYFTVHVNLWLPDIVKQQSEEMADVDARVNAVGQIWATAGVPFGIVQVTKTVNADIKAPKMKERRHITINSTATLTKFGSDAKSMITGTPKDMNLGAPDMHM